MKKKLLILFLLITIASCSKEPKAIIAISKGSGSASYENYPEWIKDLDNKVEVHDLYSLSFDEAIKVLEISDGLLLSGGPDVAPVHYGKAEDSARCSIDLHRDSLEFELIKVAQSRKIPILGICRGMQILNVAAGGSLIVDIKEDTDSRVVHQLDSGDAYHVVTVDTNSYLFEISSTYRDQVNSNHHQAIGTVADGFKAAARSEDGLVEALELADPQGKPWLMAVTWHPERLPRKHTLVNSIGTAFIRAAKEHRLNRNQK